MNSTVVRGECIHKAGGDRERARPHCGPGEVQQQCSLIVNSIMRRATAPTHGPAEIVTRGQMAAFLARTLRAGLNPAPAAG